MGRHTGPHPLPRWLSLDTAASTLLPREGAAFPNPHTDPTWARGSPDLAPISQPASAQGSGPQAEDCLIAEVASTLGKITSRLRLT